MPTRNSLYLMVLVPLLLTACSTETSDKAAPLGEVVKPVGDGAAGAPIVPCDGSEPPTTWDGKYTCGTCGGDTLAPPKCQGGQLQCTSDRYVLDMADWHALVGQCAYLKPLTFPRVALADPAGALQTNRDPETPLVLRAMPAGVGMVPPMAKFASLLKDPVKGHQAIRALFVLTDLATGAVIDYDIGTPFASPKDDRLEDLFLTPKTPLLTGKAYRVTVLPGESQSLLDCRTVTLANHFLDAPTVHDFYTSSRPMLDRARVVDKGNGAGYLVFSFTEPLSGASLSALPAVQALVDGVPVAMSPVLEGASPTDGVPTEVASIRFDVLPAAFAELSLRVPGATTAIAGGTVLAGAQGHPNAKVEGEWVVYRFPLAQLGTGAYNVGLQWVYPGK